MRKILYLTTYASPYKVEFLDELGKYADITVLFSDRMEDQSHRSSDWFVQVKGRFHPVQLQKSLMQTQGRRLCLDVMPWLRKPWDDIIIAGYSCPTAAIAELWLKMKKLPFYMEVDGGLIREDSPLQYRIKRTLVRTASAWLSSGDYTTDYLVHYGADRSRVHTYPFTSLWEKDILKAAPTQQEKAVLRKRLSMEEKKIVLYVGRFTEAKGMDALLQAAPALDADTGVYFVGGEPEEKHLQFCREHGLSHVHFVGFQKKESLKNYYLAADLMVLPTKSDVWGLVINEAMSLGLPVITTDRCVAGMELIQDGINGYIVPVGDGEKLRQAIHAVLRADYGAMGRNALETIRPYSIENMAKIHMDILEGRR